MNFRKYLLMGTAALTLSFFAACSDDDEPVRVPDDDQEQEGEDDDKDDETTTDWSDPSLWADTDNLTWPANATVELNTHYTVPEGKSLTIEPGVQIIANPAGVGINGTPIEFTVDGNLYCEGTAEAPIRFTIPEAERPAAEEALAGYWGGIMATTTCAEMIIDHTIIEYTGGQVIEDSPAAITEAYTAGDDAYPQITTNNINGKYVITNSVLRYGWSDGIYLMGGEAIIANNIFAGNGYDGAEAVNVKAGCKVDVAGNLMYSPNTNGLKLSSSGQGGDRGQALIQAYNNTIINAGWRRDGEKGGCIYVEKNAKVNVFNNLLVNCKFRAKTPSWDIPNNPEEGYDNSSVIDYNYYASGSQRSDIVWEEESGVAYAWEGYNFDDDDYNTGVVDANSFVATEDNLGDPMFVNYDVNGVALTNYTYDEAWDFHLQAGSPALNSNCDLSASEFAPIFAGGLSVNGQTYTSPAPQAQYGAFGE